MKPTRETASPDGNKVFRFYRFAPDLSAWMVDLAAGEKHYIPPAEPDDDFAGVLFLSGGWRLHNSRKESGPEDLGWHPRNPDGTWPQAWWSDYNAADYCEAGPKGVKWFCLQTKREVVYQAVSGSTIVLPGWSAIVVTDEINYFEASDTERNILGTAHILLAK